MCILQEGNFQVGRSHGFLKVTEPLLSPKTHSHVVYVVKRLFILIATGPRDHPHSHVMYLQHSDSKKEFPMGNRSIAFRILCLNVLYVKESLLFKQLSFPKFL